MRKGHNVYGGVLHGVSRHQSGAQAGQDQGKRRRLLVCKLDSDANVLGQQRWHIWGVKCILLVEQLVL